MRVKVFNPQWLRRHLYFFPIEEFHEYEGEVAKCKWAGDHELAIVTADSVGLRIIQRRHIREIDGQPYEYIEGLDAVKDRVVEVQGSKGKTYTVTLGKNRSCTCPGFTFRGSCRHITELASA